MSHGAASARPSPFFYFYPRPLFQKIRSSALLEVQTAKLMLPLLENEISAVVQLTVVCYNRPEQYNMAFKIVRTESRLVRRILTNHGFSEVILILDSWKSRKTSFFLFWRTCDIFTWYFGLNYHHESMFFDTFQRFQSCRQKKNKDLSPSALILFLWWHTMLIYGLPK